MQGVLIQRVKCPAVITLDPTGEDAVLKASALEKPSPADHCTNLLAVRGFPRIVAKDAGDP